MMIPDNLRETIERVHGEAGRRWIAAIPSMLTDCRRRWSLKLDPPFPDLSYNLVIPGRDADGVDVVLKLGVPCDELRSEVQALALFGGDGCARLIDHDLSGGALLLERVTPGTPMHAALDDPEATRAAASLMLRLWRDSPVGHGVQSLDIWFRAFERIGTMSGGAPGPFPPGIIEKAERIFRELHASSERSVILHGDLHHANILLSSDAGWVAIDPKGISGDPGYEIGPFMMNRLPDGISDSALMEIFDRRLSIFSDELSIDKHRLARWAFCHAVLSAAWSFEESSEWRVTIHRAQLLDRLSGEYHRVAT